MSDPLLHTALPEPAVLAAVLQRQLPDFGDVAWLAETGSTNADLMARTRGAGPAKPWLLGAHRQTSGRGRAGRRWQDHPGGTLMFSCAFDIDLPAGELPSFSLLAGLAACEALRGLAGAAAEHISLKWPNDVQWHDAKLAGILVESTRDITRRAGYTLVMGMGLNLRDADRLSVALDRPIADWTCVTEHNGATRAVHAADLVAAVALAWHEAVTTRRTADFAAFVARFDRVDALAGREINVLDQGRVILSGRARGCDAHARLLIDSPQGRVPVSIGEVSVRTRS
jgi:BirA family biotin operon repressor/biotin-[acetyl-CoA-carboxylase] ligase